jgi:hypothetical protein
MLAKHRFEPAAPPEVPIRKPNGLTWQYFSLSVLADRTRLMSDYSANSPWIATLSFSVWYIFLVIHQQLDSSIYSGRLIANEMMNLAFRLAIGVLLAFPGRQIVGRTQMVLVKYLEIIDLL